MSGSNPREAVLKRLEGYWKLEIGNAVFMPATILLVTHSQDSDLGWLSWASFLPMCALLIVGGLYWRAKLQVLQGQPEKLPNFLAWAGPLEIPLGLLSLATFVAAIASWFLPGLSVSLADRIAASLASLLAVLEFVNYYHRQVQHFDHKADFQRLVTGKGFRRAQMAVDLARYRA